jgi:NAD(P)-dependent dehydrogenase (short-subunit alcohol dehydrogenase family)
MGPFFSRKAAAPPEPRSDLLGRVCVVTGATSGIGKEVARGLALKRATVVVAARDELRGRAAQEEISDDTSNPAVSFLEVDVASQRSIRAFAAKLAAQHPQVHVLVNNAAVWLDRRETTEDGVERTWATNVVGYFLVTKLLLPNLTAAGTKERTARVVNVASVLAKRLDLDDVAYEKRTYHGMDAYAASKQADRMLTWALAEKLRFTNVTANALHPGGVTTNIARGPGAHRVFARVANRILGTSPEKGADTAVWLASSASVEGDTGEFFVNRKRVACRFRDEEEVAKLWEICERMTEAPALAKP